MADTPYIHIEPSDPRHRQLIHAAIKARDTEALASLKGNLSKPIDFVLNGFYYALIVSSCESGWRDVVVIYRPQTRLDVARGLRLLADKRRSRNDETLPETAVPAESDEPPMPIPLDTYDFLL